MVTTVTHEPQEMLYLIASVGTIWIVHAVALSGSRAHWPVQCQVLKSGVFAAWQPLLR